MLDLINLILSHILSINYDDDDALKSKQTNLGLGTFHVSKDLMANLFMTGIRSTRYCTHTHLNGAGQCWI